MKENNFYKGLNRRQYYVNYRLEKQKKDRKVDMERNIDQSNGDKRMDFDLEEMKKYVNGIEVIDLKNFNNIS
jgi:hypothetical protein